MDGGAAFTSTGPTPMEKRIRSLRKKLKQIESLKLLTRSLSDEEDIKLSKETECRTELLGLLPSIKEEFCSSEDLYGSSLPAETDYVPVNEEVESDVYVTAKKSGLKECNTRNIQTSRTMGDQVTAPTETVGDVRTELSSFTSNVLSSSNNLLNDTSPAPTPAESLPKNAKDTGNTKSTAVNSRNAAGQRPPPGKGHVSGSWLNLQFETRSLEGHSEHVTCVSVGHSMLLTGSRDTTARLWSVSSGDNLAHFGAHTDAVTGVCLLEREKACSLRSALDGEITSPLNDNESGDPVAVTCSLDCSMKLWCCRPSSGGELLKSVYLYNPIRCVTVWSASKCLLIGMEGGKVLLWSLEVADIIDSHRLEGENNITCLACEGEYAVAGTSDGFIHVFQCNRRLTAGSSSESVGQVSPKSLTHIYCCEVSNNRPSPLRSVLLKKDSVYCGTDRSMITVINWRTGSRRRMYNHTIGMGETDAIVTLAVKGIPDSARTKQKRMGSSGGSGVSESSEKSSGEGSSEVYILYTAFDYDRGRGYINVRTADTDDYLGSLEFDEGCGHIVCLGSETVISPQSSATISLAVGGSFGVFLLQSVGASASTRNRKVNDVKVKVKARRELSRRMEESSSDTEEENYEEEESYISESEDSDLSSDQDGNENKAREGGAGGWWAYCSIL